MEAAARTRAEPDQRRLGPEREAVRALARDFGDSAGELALGMARYLHEQADALDRARDAELFEETRASCEANILQICELLARDLAPEELTLPTPARDYAVGLVRRRIPVAELLRTYRLGHRWLWDRIAERLAERIADHDALARTSEICSDWLFRYVDRIADDLVEAYADERERWVRSAAAVRAETVRALLGGELVDEGAASGRLGYRLARHHLGLVLSGNPKAGPVGLRGLEQAAGSAAATLGCEDPLTVPAGAATLWAWCGSAAPIGGHAVERLAGFRADDGVRVAAGEPAHGIDGFQATHAQALESCRVAVLAGSRWPTTRYASIELVSLLTSDFERARAFVGRELGPLAGDEDGVRRLRATLLVFLQTGGSHVKTARRVGIHQNTVAYRIARAEELLGRAVTASRAQLEAALLLAETLGEAAFEGSDRGS